VAAEFFWKNARSWLAEASDALASVFLAGNCRVCERILTHSSRAPVCQDCLSSFQRMPKECCDVCGQPLPEVVDTESAKCPACLQQTYAFERARSYAVYEDTLVRTIVLLKFEQIEPLGCWFADRLTDVIYREGSRFKANVVVPVPLHRFRYRERGFNQAALIAKPLAKRLKLPVENALLVRTKPRPDKRVLSTKERWESVRGAFATQPGSRVDNQRVLLVDDVMTTGATLDACARALLDRGAQSVIGLTVARAIRRSARIPASP